MNKATELPLRQSSVDRYAFLLIPGLELAALLLIPFLREDVGKALLLQVSIAVFVLLGLLDAMTAKVPNVIVYPSLVFILMGTAILSPELLDDALLGGGSLLMIMFVLAIFGRGSLGMGDVKFSCLVGCLVGWQVGIVAIASGFALGAAVAVPLLLFRVRTLKDSMPLTPFLATGAIAWIVLVGSLVTQ